MKQVLSIELNKGGSAHARRTKWVKKLVGEGPKTKLAESQFLKRSSCYSIKNNQMKQYFASFITKPLKLKICSISAAVSDTLKSLHISAVFIFGQYQYSVPGNVYLLSKFEITEI